MTLRLRAVWLCGLAIWPVFLVVAVALGAVREGVIAPVCGEQTAHVLGTLVFVFVMLTIQWVFVGRVRKYIRPGDLWLIGLMWTMMTVCFEFGFFHFAAGVPWEKLLADYNIFAGRVWLLVLLTTLFGLPVINAVRRPAADRTGQN